MSLIEVAGAFGACLPPVGAGVAFVARKYERRFAKIEGLLEACQEREKAGQEKRGIQRTVLELLWQEVKRLAPHSPALRRGQQLLNELLHDDDPALLEPAE